MGLDPPAAVLLLRVRLVTTARSSNLGQAPASAVGSAPDHCHECAAGLSEGAAPRDVQSGGMGDEDDGGLGGDVNAAAAVRTGFVNSNQTTHGMTTAELTAKLAEVGIGIRPVCASDLQ